MLVLGCYPLAEIAALRKVCAHMRYGNHNGEEAWMELKGKGLGIAEGAMGQGEVNDVSRVWDR